MSSYATGVYCARPLWFKGGAETVENSLGVVEGRPLDGEMCRARLRPKAFQDDGRQRPLSHLRALGRHTVVRLVVAPLPLRNVVADHEAKEQIIHQSEVDWVIVRPPRLTNGPRTGDYRYFTYQRGSGMMQSKDSP